ncbi:hypothetical protein NX059_002662 [Plenodomus lindquistii]|nr:hypothetical protein NX059_002662 [Plenodomus lindquistii]
MMVADPGNVQRFHKDRYHVLYFVAQYGDLEAARFVYYYEVEKYPWNIYDRVSKPEYRRSERTLCEIEPSDPEIFDFLQEKRKIHDVFGQFGPFRYERFLRYSSRRGWTAMAARYLELGAHVGGTCPPDEQQPFLCAVSRGDEHIVRLFLWHGMKVQSYPKPMEQAADRGYHAIVQILLHHNAEPGDAVYYAARRGHWDVVLEMIRHGVVKQADLQRCLVYTVHFEHKAMFRLLLDYGARVSNETTLKECLDAGRAEGLESMLDLIAETGEFAAK